MTEVELAKLLRKSNYTCEGVNCDECKKTNYIHGCLMADVQIYCDDILGADDNYIEKLEKENEELKEKVKGFENGDVAWQGDMDATIQQNMELKAQIEELKKHVKYQSGCIKHQLDTINLLNGGIMNIKIKTETFSKVPEFKTEGAACADCYAYTQGESVTIYAGERQLVSLGFALELPQGYEAVIRPRSGNSKNGIDVAIGTIDCDYRGIVMANIINNSNEDLIINNQDRICQLAIRQVPKINFIEVEELNDTERGSNGFGSTGK